MTIFSQQDPQYSELPLGFSSMTIGTGGCLITSIGNLLGFDPNTVNERLKGVNGFAAPQNVPEEKNLVIWAKIAEAFPPVTANRVWAYNDEEVRANAGHVLVEVSGAPIGGGKNGKHWIILKDVDTCIDPFTGLERPFADFPDRFGYAIINGIAAQVEAVPEGTATETPEENPNIYKGLDLTNIDSVKAAIDAWHEVANGAFIRVDDHLAAIKSIADNLETNPDIDSINNKINELKARTTEITEPQTVEVIKEVPANPDTLISPEKSAKYPALVTLWKEILVNLSEETPQA